MQLNICGHLMVRFGVYFSVLDIANQYGDLDTLYHQ